MADPYEAILVRGIENITLTLGVQVYLFSSYIDSWNDEVVMH